MRLYESVFIARQDITSAQVETMADEFAKIITSSGGSIKKREYWGLRGLAYRIKKNRKGHFVCSIWKQIQMHYASLSG
jgi:small subunit ribosomal protein S6